MYKLESITGFQVYIRLQYNLKTTKNCGLRYDSAQNRGYTHVYHPRLGTHILNIGSLVTLCTAYGPLVPNLGWHTRVQNRYFRFIFYYAGEKLKTKSTLGFHSHCVYSPTTGEFVTGSNSQMVNTPVVI